MERENIYLSRYAYNTEFNDPKQASKKAQNAW